MPELNATPVASSPNDGFFSTDEPTKSLEQWETISPDGLKVIYAKTSWREGFRYGCKCVVEATISEISWESAEDLLRDEVEELFRDIENLFG